MNDCKLLLCSKRMLDAQLTCFGLQLHGADVTTFCRWGPRGEAKTGDPCLCRAIMLSVVASA